MSDQFVRKLFGQYSFGLDSDRAATSKNLRIGGDSVAVTPVANAVNLDASLSSSFTVTNAAATTFTTSNLVQGQMLRVIFTNTAVGNVTNVFTAMTGLSVAIATTKIVLFSIFKIGSTVYFTQAALS